MFRPRVIPCLLLDHNGLVKTKQFSEPVYVGDAMNSVKIFNELEADEIIFLDIYSTERSLEINFELIAKIADEAFMPVAYGGGLDTLQKVKDIFNSGVEKIVLNSAFYNNPELISEASNIFGSQAVIVSFDVKKINDEYVVFRNRGRDPLEINIVESIKMAEELGAGEIFINHIDRDGTFQGYDGDLIEKASMKATVPLIACGGAGDYEDLKHCVDAGASAAAAGSLFVFLGGRNSVMINYPDKEELDEIFGDDS